MPPRLIPARGNEPLRRSVPVQFGENHEGTRRYTNGIREWHTASSGGVSTPFVSVRIHSWFKLSHDPKIKNALQDRTEIQLSPPRVALLSRVAEVHPPPPPREGVKPFYAECSGHGFTLPLHDTNAHGHPCISTLQQMRNPFSIHPTYTTGENPVSYNQKLGVARAS